MREKGLRDGTVTPRTEMLSKDNGLSGSLHERRRRLRNVPMQTLQSPAEQISAQARARLGCQNMATTDATSEQKHSRASRSIRRNKRNRRGSGGLRHRPDYPSQLYSTRQRVLFYFLSRIANSYKTISNF